MQHQNQIYSDFTFDNVNLIYENIEVLNECYNL